MVVKALRNVKGGGQMRKVFLLVSVLVVMLLVSSCGGETRVIEVESYQWGWTPETITVKQGEKIRLVITSTAEMDQDFPFHGFVLEGYDISQTLPVGEPTVVEFVANKTGNFPFFCSIYCGTGHEEMTGTLKVE